MEWTSDVASVVSSLRRAAAGYVPCTEWPFDVAAVVSNLHKAVAGGYGPEGEVVSGLLLEAFHRWSCHSNERTQHSDFDGASANSVRHHVTSTSRQNAAAPTGFGEDGRHCHGGDIFGRFSAQTVNDANPAPESSSDGAPSEVATPGESLRCVCPLLRPLEVRWRLAAGAGSGASLPRQSSEDGAHPVAPGPVRPALKGKTKKASKNVTKNATRDATKNAQLVWRWNFKYEGMFEYLGCNLRGDDLWQCIFCTQQHHGRPHVRKFSANGTGDPIRSHFNQSALHKDTHAVQAWCNARVGKFRPSDLPPRSCPPGSKAPLILD